jgi:O-antigen/teichoic acid export membrane protein
LSKRELFIKNTLFNTAFKVLNQLIALFILPLFVKNLGSELYGIWVICNVVIGYLGIMDLGFSQGVMKYISEALSKKNTVQFSRVFSSSTALFFIIGTFVCIFILVFNEIILSLFSIDPMHFNSAKNLLIISALFSPLFWTARITDITFKGALQFKSYSILSGLQAFGRTISMLYMVYFGYDIVTIFIISNAVYFILWLPSIIVLKRMFPALVFSYRNIKIKTIKEMAPFSLGVFYASLTSMLAIQLDSLIIGMALSMSAVTAYTVVSKLFYTAYQYMGMLSGVLQPTSFHAFANNDRLAIEKLMEKGTKYMNMLYTPIGYMGIIISPMFIDLWMGQNYLHYAGWSQLFMLIFVITAGLGIPLNLVFNSGRTKVPNIMKTFYIIINLLISILLINKYGIGGPIIGTLVAEFLFIFTFPYFCKLMNFNWLNYATIKLKITCINIPATIFFYWMQSVTEHTWINLILLLGIMTFVYFGTFYFMVFTNDEKRDLSILASQFKPKIS